ncbi:unnamed protein product [Dovyalis caffra]|uniref:Wall-associated receptor kinase galacturonan-binding domain-containing protein n=1 Tax=Dovyalis caffra TaxID=77055 RepID=A0AAV1S6R9_9ROSI|nr:unnamed protein product [Dovyalis caffra]
MAVQVQLMFQVMMLLLWLFNFPSVIVEAQPIAKAGCHDQHCGRVKIPYPFGMDSSCYLEKSYKIDCNSGRPTIHVNGTNLEVTEISVGVARNTIRVNLPIIFENCNSRRKSNDEVVVDFVVHLGGSPFAFSGTENSFVAVGCNNLALLAKNETIYAGGCLSICDGNGKVASTAKSSCNGVNCCQTTIPSNLKFFGTSFIPFSPEMVDDKGDKGNTCKYAYLVEQNWLLDRLYHNSLGKPYYSVTDRKTVPAVLNWSIDSRLRSRLPVINDSRYKLSSCNDTPLTLSDDTNQTITQCFCLHGFRGNPYVSYGCDDVNECEEHTHDCYRKALECKNTYGSYECVMPEHNKSRGKMVVSGTWICAL